MELRKQANDYKVGTLPTCVFKILVRKAKKIDLCVCYIISALVKLCETSASKEPIDTVGHINLSIVNWMNIYSSLIFFAVVPKSGGVSSSPVEACVTYKKKILHLFLIGAYRLIG